MKIMFYFLFFINRKFKILIKKKVGTTVEFLFYINKKLNILIKQKIRSIIKLES